MISFSIHEQFIIPGMTRAEMLLKVVMSPLDPSIVFVEQYVRLVQGKLDSVMKVCIDIKHVSF